jgi:hypothetical protein
MNTRIILIGLVLAAIAGSWTAGYRYAKVQFDREVLALKERFRERQDALRARLKAEQQKRRVIYRDRIKVVESASGGCLDRPVPDRILRAIRGSDDRS